MEYFNQRPRMSLFGLGPLVEIAKLLQEIIICLPELELVQPVPRQGGYLNRRHRNFSGGHRQSPIVLCFPILLLAHIAYLALNLSITSIEILSPIPLWSLCFVKHLFPLMVKHGLPCFTEIPPVALLFAVKLGSFRSFGPASLCGAAFPPVRD